MEHPHMHTGMLPGTLPGEEPDVPSTMATSAIDLPELRGLEAQAPPSTFLRFRRRAGMVQGTRMLFESQVTGFWVVLDTLLRHLLGSSAPPSPDPLHAASSTASSTLSSPAGDTA
jgi:hypothetical protein